MYIKHKCIAEDSNPDISQEDRCCYFHIVTKKGYKDRYVRNKLDRVVVNVLGGYQRLQNIALLFFKALYFWLVVHMFTEFPSLTLSS